MKFTPQEIALIRDKAATHTAAQIAEMTGRSRRAIANKAYELRISMKKHGDTHYRVKHSDHDIELCRALFEEGVSIADIAEKMEIDRSYVSNIVHFHKRKPA